MQLKRVCIYVSRGCASGKLLVKLSGVQQEPQQGSAVQPALRTTKPDGTTQFALSQLIALVTICAILARLSTYIGFAAGICLMLMAFALAAKQGMLALTLLAAASLLADWSLAPGFAGSLLCQSIILLIAAALCAWYHPRDSEQLSGVADITSRSTTQHVA